MDERETNLTPDGREDMDTATDARGEPMDAGHDDGEHHATTAGSALAGAVTGGVIGLAGGPLGAAVGAIGGAIVGAAAERTMHHDEDLEGDAMGLEDDRDANWAVEDREKEMPAATTSEGQGVVERQPVDRRPADSFEGAREHESMPAPASEERVSVEKNPTGTTPYTPHMPPGTTYD